MRTICINMDNKDYDKIYKAKGNLSWREFIIELVDNKAVKE
jgi:predicted CopG family antitoxin